MRILDSFDLTNGFSLNEIIHYAANNKFFTILYLILCAILVLKLLTKPEKK